MCGIAGIWEREDSRTDGLGRDAERMAAALIHRGPDASGLWLDERAALALSHRRLSIVDLSPHGAQPMLSACGRYVICLNGEIYNHRRIRSELDAAGRRVPWRGHSDTEVALEAVAAWGLAGALRRFEGMFAFALWDRQDRLLHLARDRFGEKPLFYGRIRGGFVFASELKALRVHPRWEAAIDRASLSMYFRYGYIPAPGSIFEGIRKLPPGTTVSLQTPDSASEPVPYWSLEEAARRGAADPFRAGAEAAVGELETLLDGSIAQQMLADVPVGAFLSGGIDSSLIVALMAKRSPGTVKTFTIGFDDPRFDESMFARNVAAHLGTDHTELRVRPEQAMELVSGLAAPFDEPFGDSSQIPTMLVSRLARRTVTVALSGDGGDELFGGYNHYRWGTWVSGTFGWMPMALRRLVGRSIRGGMRGAGRRDRRLGKMADILSHDSASALYWGLTAHSLEPGPVLGSGPVEDEALGRLLEAAGDPSFLSRMMYVDQMRFLPDDILTKVDRAAMRYSLETRAPFLNHPVAEFAWRLPSSMKIRDGKGKWLLRRILSKYVPDAMIDRPKMGFGLPLTDWLRGPLRPWAESLVEGDALRRQGYLDPAWVRRNWDEHQAGRDDRFNTVWNILMFESWLTAGGL